MHKSNNDRKGFIHTILSQVIGISALLLVISCTPPGIPPQASCPASLGGDLALHDVNSLNTYPQPQWASWGGNLHNTRNNPNETILNPGNVANLEVKWSFIASGTVRANPTIEGDLMYFADSGPSVDVSTYFAGSSLWAVNRHDASLVWKKQMRDYNDNDYGNMISGSPAIAGDLIIIGDYQNAASMIANPSLINHESRYVLGFDDPCSGYVTAIKRDGPNAGERVWSTRIGEDDYAQVHQSPVVYGDTVYVGLSSQQSTHGRIWNFPCCDHRGKVVALDVHTGAVKWTTYMTPAQFGGIQGFSGVSAWGGSPTVDAARNLVYVGTGNNYTVPEAFENCMVAAGNDLLEQATCAAVHNALDNYVDSIVALDMTTGQVEWSFYSREYDPFNTACSYELVMPVLAFSSSRLNCAPVAGADADFAQPPMLYTTDVGGVARQRLAAGTKGGQFFILDPDAPTEASRLVFSGQIGPGGVIGGFEFGSATDGERIYVANSNFEHKPYTLVAGSPDYVAGTTIYGGFWAALDAETGAILWETPVPYVPLDPADLSGTLAHTLFGLNLGQQFFSWNFGPVSVANGVVYAAVADWTGSYVAMDASTGEVLWHFEGGYGSDSGPTIVDGELYWGSGSNYAKMGAKKVYKFGLP